jgi:hypothetical protein
MDVFHHQDVANHVSAFIEANPPDSLPTDISLSQYLAIQEKGKSFPTAFDFVLS